MTFHPDPLQRQTAHSEPASVSAAPLRCRRGRAGAVIAALLSCAWVLAAACTLTNDEFEPPLVDSDPILAPEKPPAEPAPEPDASVCAGGDACCADLPCPAGESCVEGRCVVPEAGDAGAPDCVGSDCPGSMPAVPLAPSCDDGAQNGDETGSDCGGSCERACDSGAGCVADVDCADGLFCSQPAARCTEISCSDGALNGAETAIDCGGGTCGGCADGQPCSAGADCESLVCGENSICAEPSCNDDQPNGNETSTDCGGMCPAECADGQGCEDDFDCQSDVCGPQGCAAGLELCCQPPACDDGEENGTEIDVDCGGSCAPCPDSSDCTQDSDCLNNNCDPSGTCISCGDAVSNGTETGIDCGGDDLACRRCNAGEACTENPDCVNMFCLAGLCT